MKSVRRGFKISKLRDSIARKVFTHPNIRLRLHIKDRDLDADLCEDLQKKLKLKKVDLAFSFSHTGHKYHRHKWEFRVENIGRFKRALSKYSKDNPDMDISSDDLEVLYHA